MNRETIIFIVILLNFFCIPDLSGAPSSKQVKKELSRLLEKNPHYKTAHKFYIKRKEQKKEARVDLSPIINFFRSIKNLIGLGIIIMMIILILSLIKKFQPFITGNAVIKQSHNSMKEEKNNQALTVHQYYNQALTLFRQGDFNKAIILLHYASIEYLKEKMILGRTVEYTNNDIKKIIQNEKPYSRAFSIISHFAELAGFSNRLIRKEEFTQVNTQFKQIFYDNYAGKLK